MFSLSRPPPSPPPTPDFLVPQEGCVYGIKNFASPSPVTGPFKGGFLSPDWRAGPGLPDGSRRLPWVNALPPADGSPSALVPPAPPHSLPSTSGPLCFVARNNLLLPSCSEVTSCPWLDSTRPYHQTAFELAVAFLCGLIRCQGGQWRALHNSGVARPRAGVGAGRLGS